MKVIYNKEKQIASSCIVIRADSSEEIGTGHISRTIRLGKKFKERFRVVYISRNLKGNINYLVKQEFELFEIKGAADVKIENEYTSVNIKDKANIWMQLNCRNPKPKRYSGCGGCSR